MTVVAGCYIGQADTGAAGVPGSSGEVDEGRSVACPGTRHRIDHRSTPACNWDHTLVACIDSEISMSEIVQNYQ